MGIIIKKKTAGENKEVKKELAKLIEQTPAPVKKKDADDKAADAAFTKLAVRWAKKERAKEFKAAGDKAARRRWAVTNYQTHLDATPAPKKNEAMEALVKGSEKRAAKKTDAAKIIPEVKKESAQAMQANIDAFIDVEVKDVANALIDLFVSRGAFDSIQAATALDKCRAAFDKCGLLLTDVEVKGTSPTKAAKPVKKTKPAKKAKK